MRINIVIPLKSKQGSGMCRAGTSLLEVIPGEFNPKESVFNQLFLWINDARFPGALKMLFRLVLVQFTFLEKADITIYASHHAPFFRSKQKTIVIIHDLISLENPSQHRFQTLLFKYYVPLVLNNATGVVTISKDTRAKLAEYFGITANGVEVIPSAFDTLRRWERGGSTFQERRGTHQLLFVGAKYEHKNLGLLLDAIPKTSERDYRVLIINGELDYWLNRVSNSNQHILKQSCDFVPYVTDEELEKAYASSAALIYVSRSEGMGIPPLEAFHKGCPVVCSDLSVLRETCGNAAIYVDPDDSDQLARQIDFILSEDHEQELTRLKTLGFQVTDGYQSDVLAKKWRNCLNRFLQPSFLDLVV